MGAWRYDSGLSWVRVGTSLAELSDAEGWNSPKYYETIQTGDPDGDGTAELIARGSTGIRNFGFQGGAWDSASTQFPAFDTPGEAGAYDHINAALGGRKGTAFDLRDNYPRATGGDLSRWSAQIARMPQPNDVTPADWKLVSEQLLRELDDAIAVQDWFDNYVNGVLVELFVAKSMDSSAQELEYNTQAKTELRMAQWELFAGIFESVAEVSGLLFEVEAASLLAGILATGVSSQLEFSGIATVEEVRGTYLEVQGDLQASFLEAAASPRFMREAIMSDYGLLNAVGTLIGNGTWERMSAAVQKEAANRALRAYAVSVWQTITPALWSHWTFDNADTCPKFEVGCDFKAGGKGHHLYGQVSFFNKLYPSTFVEEELKEKVFEETNEARCLEATGEWNANTCSLGVGKSEFFLGDDWDLPAVHCDDWAQCTRD